MTAAEIKEYLGMCIGLEKETYTQGRAIAQLKYQISLLGNYCQLYEPQYKKPLYSETKEKGELCIIGSVFLGALGLLTGILSSSFTEFFMFFAIPLLVVGGLLWFFGGIANDEADREARKQHAKAVEQYKNRLVEDAKRVDAERVKRAALQSSLNMLCETNKKSRRCLQQLYAKDVLYPKYRNYACVCALYEYFASGRCTTLTGHEGAYNMLEPELRLNRIITQNDQILASLEEIKANQEMLYDSIQDANQKADQIIRNCNYMSNQLNGIQTQGAELNARIERLQTTSDLNLYVNACAKRELEYMNRANRIF